MSNCVTKTVIIDGSLTKYYLNAEYWVLLYHVLYKIMFMLQDHDFFQHLEMHIRAELPPLCGRDHLAFRSYYFPVKVTILYEFI